tara:strand:+ start:1662 stop:1862 length:201 start_codon:yes stop_codon:yes gene_type:complete
MENRKENMNYNIITLIGVAIIVGGFLLFLYSEIKEREADRQEAQSKRFIEALERSQIAQNIRKDIR